MKKLSCIGALLVALSGSAVALEVSELTSGLTRSYADRHFSKDYHYRILEDNSVRRTWKAAGKSIIVDFDIRTEKVVSIIIDYEPSAEKRAALADVKSLTEGRREGVKWTPTKKNAVERVGMKKNTRLMRLTDKSLLFWEAAGKNKCSRLCWFAQAPTVDRMTIGDASETSGRTAMGNTSMTGAAKQLRIDEERRMHIEPTPAPGTAIAATKPTPRPAATGKPTAAATPAVTPRPAPRPAVPVATIDDTELDVPDTESTESTETTEAKNLLQALGIELDDNMRKIIAGVGGLLVLLILWNIISSARRKAKQRKAFENLLNNKDNTEK